MFDVKPTIDFEAILAAQDDVELKAETSYDLKLLTVVKLL
jgi:hypothetical protein